jgi:MerR family transcriptional regulator, thiopeptide resistance regulator
MPESHPITPLLVYEDIEAAHGFLVDAFGFTAGRLDRDANGNVVHGEVSAAAQVIWLHRAAADHELASAVAQAMATGGLVVDVDNVDAHVAHARSRGAVIKSDPTNQPYGRREYEARDLENHRWWFGTPLP